MQTQHIAIRDQQKDSWNTFSPGWRKWDDFTMRFLQGQRDEIINALDPMASHHILDVAAGTGEPGLTMAPLVYEGSVTAVDLSEGMLQIAREKALAKNMTNFYTRVADVSELPFSDNTFDAVSCRLGFMFFPDVDQAAKEIIRVLKPGGKIAATVWGEPVNNLWITAIMSAIKRNVDIPTPPAGAPGMFRCALPGFMQSLFEKAGASHGVEAEISGYMTCTSKDEYWAFMNDVVPPVVSVFRDSDASVKECIKKEVYELLDEKFPGDQKNIGFGARLLVIKKSI